MRDKCFTNILFYEMRVACCYSADRGLEESADWWAGPVSPESVFSVVAEAAVLACM